MNYIRHLNAFFSYVKSDNRLTASHVSLYLALFQYWNFNRFQNPFPVYRTDIMNLCKIGSKNTYHKCIKELHHCKYIFYHPATQKYQPVKISMIRLDKQVPKNPEQLDMFCPPREGVARSAGGGISTSTNFDTTHVPDLTPASPDNNTGTVPKMGQHIKPNNKQERETPTHKVFKRNKKIQENTNNLAVVPNVGHQPSLPEVQALFAERSYPAEEATKFYNHYKALGWKIQGKTPIEDWKPLVEKWMTNAKRWNLTETSLPLKGQPSRAKVADEVHLEGGLCEANLQYLYTSFLQDKKIFHLITPAHFDQLNLRLDEEAMQQAWNERINQVSGTNQHSLIEIWKAYLTSDPSNPLLQKDKPNLIALAKRIAVINHFYHLKQSGTKELPP
jgi:hypothetical protein